jgi:hypothetical protein
MAKLGISTGAFPNDGLGDSLLDGGIKINNNFDEIYTYFGDGTDLTFTTNGTITNLTGTAATITTLSSTNGTITNLTGTAATITTLSSTNGTITNLTGTAATITNFNSTNLVGAVLNIDGTSTFTIGPVIIGTSSSTGTMLQPLQITGGTYISGNLGVGTTNPTSALTIVGSGTSTSQLYVNEISTLGTVQISSGIVTSSSGISGIVTYYGDTSYTISGRWSLGANGTSDYTFTGIGFTETTNNPILYLARGRVYEFVNNSGGSHPFEIRENDGGPAYSDGVTNNGAATGVIRVEIPFNAPNTLYYQCTNHSGMGNTISVYPSTI